MKKFLRDILNDISNYRYYQNKISEINMSIYRLRLIMGGVKGISFDGDKLENASSNKDQLYLDSIEKIDKLKAKRNEYLAKVALVEYVIKKVKGEARIYIIEHYLQDKTLVEIAEARGVTARRIGQIIEKGVEEVYEGNESDV